MNERGEYGQRRPWMIGAAPQTTPSPRPPPPPQEYATGAERYVKMGLIGAAMLGALGAVGYGLNKLLSWHTRKSTGGRWE